MEYHQSFKKRKQKISLFLVFTLVSSVSTYSFGNGDFIDVTTVYATRSNDGDNASSGGDGDSNGDKKSKSSSKGSSDRSDSGKEKDGDRDGGGNSDTQSTPDSSSDNNPEQQQPPAVVDSTQSIPNNREVPLAEQQTIAPDNAQPCNDGQPRDANGNCPPPLAASTSEPCPDNQPRDANGNCPTFASPDDLAAPPSSTDPDFCLKSFGRQQLTGEATPSQCMPPSSPQDNGPSTDQQNQKQLATPPKPTTTGGTAEGCPTGTYRSESTDFKCVPFSDQQPQQNQQQQLAAAPPTPPSPTVCPASTSTYSSSIFSQVSLVNGQDGLQLPADFGDLAYHITQSPAKIISVADDCPAPSPQNNDPSTDQQNQQQQQQQPQLAQPSTTDTKSATSTKAPTHTGNSLPGVNTEPLWIQKLKAANSGTAGAKTGPVTSQQNQQQQQHQQQPQLAQPSTTDTKSATSTKAPTHTGNSLPGVNTEASTSTTSAPAATSIPQSAGSTWFGPNKSAKADAFQYWSQIGGEIGAAGGAPIAVAAGAEATAAGWGTLGSLAIGSGVGIAIVVIGALAAGCIGYVCTR